MLGTGKVKLVEPGASVYDIMAKFYSIGNTNWSVSMKRTDELLNMSGSNRVRLTPSTTLDVAQKDDVLEHVNEVSKTYVRRICETLSMLTSPFKRKCAMMFFISNGTYNRFPEDFKLKVDTDDMVRNVENEEINKLIDEFGVSINKEFEDAVLQFHSFIDKYPRQVKIGLQDKPRDYFATEQTTNIYRAMWRLFKDADLVFSKEDQEELSNVLLPYRGIVNSISKPGDARVANFFKIDKTTYLRTARDAIYAIITSAGDKLLKNIVNGDL